jgi:hypothetical protein
MSTRTLYMAIVAAVAAAPAVHAMPTAAPHATPGVVADNGEIPRLSDAARGQILGSPNIHLVAKPRPYTQEHGPSWVQAQWRYQRKL